ncbi:MAG TPA: glycosyltransferase family 4 protein [Oligoflexia bacterium]|nr:glycosyltransferase family 4 protein [Oligoflexia bacterium]HMP27530.1 glycosyltransferase family 4 protein [Oligoflexia bacterium]
MQKILIATDYFYPHWTGISKGIYNLIRALAGKLDCTILTVRYDPTLAKEEKLFSAKVVRVSYQFKLSRSCYSLTAFLRLAREALRHDVVLINSPSANVLPFSLIAKLLGKKLIIFHQGDLILGKGFLNRMLELIYDFSTAISFRLADRISSYTIDYAQHSRSLKPFLKKFHPSLLPLHLAEIVDLTSSKLKPLQELRTKKNLLIGFGGRFVEEKGFDILFKAIPMFIEKYKREIQSEAIHFVFAGETNIFYENFFERNQELLKSVSDYVTILGLLNEEELRVFLETIDLFVVPSRSECFNLFQAEAALCKKPLVVSNIPGARVITKETGFGSLFESENPESLAEALLITAKNRQKIIEKNYGKVLTLLDNQKATQSFLELIDC